MDALDVEGAQPFLDQLLELVRQRRLLDLVFALQQVDRIGRCRPESASDGCGGRPTGIDVRTPRGWR